MIAAGQIVLDEQFGHGVVEYADRESLRVLFAEGQMGYHTGANRLRVVDISLACPQCVIGSWEASQ